ncbi:hypothetical protein [Yoonia sp. 1_MG-2023]|uniref:hypothetical protein n=1 Tax=Yoonia sp. 1_MG-2023 TaxID=3062659 RepID=UPI0011BF7B95|nr:hypothetical protein [Yoonia sp. 1_MG-2023]MDO6590959.1 hypothetical protein [Yoonia sp. 1_MG-2023]
MSIRALIAVMSMLPMQAVACVGFVPLDLDNVFTADAVVVGTMQTQRAYGQSDSQITLSIDRLVAGDLEQHLTGESLLTIVGGRDAFRGDDLGGTYLVALTWFNQPAFVGSLENPYDPSRKHEDGLMRILEQQCSFDFIFDVCGPTSDTLLGMIDDDEVTTTGFDCTKAEFTF